ncbi:MAG TPA: hypothetical protein VMV10_07725 [Pirellulales bacterium]|nr:hypothetical protein [Pirellulales bacterium]
MCESWTFNPITVSDWKLYPSERAIVVDADGLYQWEVASFGASPKSAANRGWYTSELLGAEDLELLRTTHDEIFDKLLSPPHPTDAADLAAARSRLGALYDTVERVRMRMRSTVLARHTTAKARPEALEGFTDDEPLTITVFDQLKLKDGKLKVRSKVEPLLFRAAHRAAARAVEARVAAVAHAISVAHLAEEIEAAAEAITLSAMCLEAYINGLIIDRLPNLRSELDRIEIRSKWLLVPTLLGEANCFDKGATPYQVFKSVIDWRNMLVHYKHEFACPVDEAGIGRVSHLRSICNAKNALKAVEVVVLMVRQINKRLGIPDPQWDTNRGGWLSPLQQPPSPEQGVRARNPERSEGSASREPETANEAKIVKACNEVVLMECDGGNIGLGDGTHRFSDTPVRDQKAKD